jgi:chromosome segregation ATPase
VPLKYIILEAEVEKLKEDLMREQRKTARYEKQIESILSQHNEELMRMSMQVEELKEQLAHTHRRLARSQEKLTESEEGLLIKTIHAKELMIESLQASGM